MEKLFQVVLERSAGQQQLVLQRVVVQHSEELETEREKEKQTHYFIQILKGLTHSYNIQ